MTSKPGIIASVIALLACIYLPPLAGMLGYTPGSEINEKREKTKIPELEPTLESVTSFPERFDTYFRDNFGLRDTFVRLNARLHYDLLRTSPIPGRVIVGKDGWLFLTGHGELEAYDGSNLFTRRQLQNWARLLREYRDYFAARQISFILAVVPNKFTICEDKLPLSVVRARQTSRLDQLARHLERQNLPFLDLRQAMNEAREKEEVYLRFDSHWNAAGAHASYQAIVKALARQRPELHPVARDELRREYRLSAKGDLAIMLGLDGHLAEDRLILRPIRKRRAVQRPIDGERNWRHKRYVVNDSSLPTALIFHDSFGRSLLPFLTMHFRHSETLWRVGPVMRLVEEQRPDVVIIEIAERHLLSTPPGKWERPPSLDTVAANPWVPEPAGQAPASTDKTSEPTVFADSFETGNTRAWSKARTGSQGGTKR